MNKANKTKLALPNSYPSPQTLSSRCSRKSHPRPWPRSRLRPKGKIALHPRKVPPTATQDDACAIIFVIATSRRTLAVLDILFRPAKARPCLTTSPSTVDKQSCAAGDWSVTNLPASVASWDGTTHPCSVEAETPTRKSRPWNTYTVNRDGSGCGKLTDEEVPGRLPPAGRAIPPVVTISKDQALIMVLLQRPAITIPRTTPPGKITQQTKTTDAGSQIPASRRTASASFLSPATATST
jgi:hypothetical protein